MQIQRTLALTKKELKKTIREPAVLFMIFLFPVVFVFAFGASFGGLGGSQTPNYHIGVVTSSSEDNPQWSQAFVENLVAKKIVTVSVYSENATAQADLSQGKMQALLLIPETFGDSINAYIQAPNDANQWLNSTMQLYLDKGSLIATQAVPPIIQQTLNSMLNQNQQTLQSPIKLQTASLVEVKTASTFDFMAPGMFTFASIFLIMMVAQSFTQDRENGMMKRIRISPTTPTELMTGHVLAYMCIALVQSIIVFAMTYAMGFRPSVVGSSYMFAFVLVLVFSVSNVGFGLITATIAKSSGAATGLSFLFVLPQMFLGTFVGASLSGAAQAAGKFVPSYYVTDALTSVFLRGAPLASAAVLLDLAVVSVSCIGILAAGIVLYAKYYKI
ncbi:MAG: ABC transporter permease [Candidatus Bathyarchaeota archaeon]|nr:ABC transporter permease [Candidatus Bathyarchaeota archaeon]